MTVDEVRRSSRRCCPRRRSTDSALPWAETQQPWDKMTAWLTHSVRDPKWRRRLSVLEQLRGWKRQPLAHKKANNGGTSHRNVKAAA